MNKKLLEEIATAVVSINDNKALLELARVVLEDYQQVNEEEESPFIYKDNDITGISKILSGSVIIPNKIDGESITGIADKALAHVKGLQGRAVDKITSYIIAPGIKSIGKLAFSGSPSLKTVTIPDSLEIIGDSAFYSCYHLESIHFSDNIIEIDNAVCGQCPKLETVTLPSKLQIIRKMAFVGDRALDNVTIPSSVHLIEGMAFAGCSNLKNVYFKGDAPKLDRAVFSRCNPELVIHHTKGSKGFDKDEWVEFKKSEK